MRSHVTKKLLTIWRIERRFNTASGMRSHVTLKVYPLLVVPLPFQYRKRYESTCDGKRSVERHEGETFQYRKRYEITCDLDDIVDTAIKPWSFNTASGMRSHVTVCWPEEDARKFRFQYRKRYEITCDSVSGRPQKQKAQNAVLENLLKAEHAIAYFRLSLHTPRLCNDPAAPCMARLAAIRGKSENLPRFFASERFSTFHNVA